MKMKLYLAGHAGLVGSALMRRFATNRDVELLTATRAELDLTDTPMVHRWLARTRPDALIAAAGLTGGIRANAARPAEFVYQNVMIEANLIHGAWQAGVARLLNFGSSCMYPRDCPQPMRPEQLMSGAVEPTSAPYAAAKWAGVTLCAAYRRQYGVRFVTVVPCTVYGPGDSFDPDDAHVLSALLRKLHEAKTRGEGRVTLWGSGAPRREFVFADDLAAACDVVLKRYDDEPPLNIGSGQIVSIRELAGLIASVVGFEGTIRWDASRPDGAPEKSLDTTSIRALGWTPRTSLREGIERTYGWWLEHEAGMGSGERMSCASS